ncbi:MAG: hypothetical protein AAFN50_02650 [Pseudomonadota bacterium]
MSTSDEKLEQSAKRLFDESVDGLDAATLSRLNRGRQAALEASGGGRSRWLLWAPATGVAAAAVVAAVMLQVPNTNVIDAAPADLDIILAEESIEMLEELEFYAWLDTVDLDANDIG